MLDLPAALRLLSEAALEIEGRLVDASNATFLCRLGPAGEADEAHPPRCVYKPVRGERPLDDFPPATLAKRERAAYLLSEVTGWGIVPPTVLRDGPLGPGMVQLWIEPDPDADVLAMVLAPDPRLRRICVFDVLANNADRKGSHLLPLPDGHIHGVDHGVCFAVQPKLRTVLWAWRGDSLEPDERRVVERVAQALRGPLGEQLGELLSGAEVAATRQRAVRLLAAGRLPLPDPSRPALPWPPF
ncbi:MAG TPA: SCO1664 family protein [Candidatus Limnocylindria bacterium]|nr:SCO1664 family protein [Candidatus Limnocylindria bacterium]